MKTFTTRDIDEEVIGSAIDDTVQRRAAGDGGRDMGFEAVYSSGSGSLRRLFEKEGFVVEVKHLSTPDGREMDAPWLAKVVSPDGHALWSNSYEGIGGAIEGGKSAANRKIRDHHRRSELNGLDARSEAATALINRADAVIRETNETDDCTDLVFLFLESAGIYNDFINAAENGVVDPGQMGAGTAVAEVGNAWVITRRHLIGNGCLSESTAKTVKSAPVRQNLEMGEYDEASQAVMDAVNAVTGDR